MKLLLLIPGIPALALLWSLTRVRDIDPCHLVDLGPGESWAVEDSHWAPTEPDDGWSWR